MSKDYWQKHNCDRCGASFAKSASTMSKFNQDAICMACKDDEKLAPGYDAADKAELDACRHGNYNFPGVGLSDADRAFLAKLRQERAAQEK